MKYSFTFFVLIFLACNLYGQAGKKVPWSYIIDITPEEVAEMQSRTSYPSDVPNNTVEGLVPDYTLPDLLTTSSGRKIRTVRAWEKKRRPELLEIFSNEMYGHVPGRLAGEHFVIDRVEENAFDGLGRIKYITIYLDATQEHSLHMLLAVPGRTDKRCPVFAGVNFYGLDSTLTGTRAYQWPYEKLLSEGFGLATIWRDEICPDSGRSVGHGVRDLIVGDWGAISAWAWALSRVMDYLETDMDVDASKVALIGHSRLGKTALWAGANDPRFAMVISNASGCCGASLSRRVFGENFNAIRRFTHWFCPNFWKWDDSNFPTDQHALAALIAPRPLYIASGSLDFWCDPKGEWLTAVHCQPVYDLYGKKGLSHPDRMPEVGERDDTGWVAYKIRFGKHGIIPSDWDAYIAYAQRVFGE